MRVNLTVGGSVSLPALPQTAEITRPGQGWSVMLLVKAHECVRSFYPSFFFFATLLWFMPLL